MFITLIKCKKYTSYKWKYKYIKRFILTFLRIYQRVKIIKCIYIFSFR